MTSTSTAASPLLAAIERFTTAARQRSAGGPNGLSGGPFRHYSVTNAREFLSAIEGAPGEHRVVSAGDPHADFKSEMYRLRAGNVWFGHYASQGRWTVDFSVDADYLTVYHILRGTRTFSVAGVPIATARAGDYVFIINRSPMFQLSAPDGSAGFMVYIRIPEAQRFALGGRARLDRQAQADMQSYLEHGFVIAGPSPLWGIHLSYALSYALDVAALVERGEDLTTAGGLLGEHLYLLFRQELANRAGERDADQQYVAVPLKLKVAEDYIAANAARAPTVEMVATEAGLGVRALRTLFMKFRGMSPSEFIREHRLTGVRTALRTAGPGQTVTEIATAWSFQNFGNFASAYRERFGELPSETLARIADR